MCARESWVSTFVTAVPMTPNWRSQRLLPRGEVVRGLPSNEPTNHRRSTGLTLPLQACKCPIPYRGVPVSSTHTFPSALSVSSTLKSPPEDQPDSQ